MDQMHKHGGGEKMLSLKMNALVNNYNCEVVLCTTEQDNKPSVYSISEKINCIDLGINYHRNKSYFHPLNLLKTGKHFFKLKKELKKIQPDVIVSVSQSPDQFFLPFIHKKIPKIKEFHSSGFMNNNPISLLEKLKYQLFLVYRKYTNLVVLNKDELKYYPFKNVVVIPNFIKNQQLTAIEQVKRENIIIAAGRIAPVKQFDHLIKAWSLIAKKYPNWEVHIYGEGDQLLINKLNKQIKELELTTIKFMGATNNLEEKMKAATIYALTSATECFPMVLLESLACGLPIVSYNCPHGPKNIITNTKDGILIEANNTSNFATALAKLIEDKDERTQMGQAGINNVALFSENKVMQKWIQLFNKRL